ncbi:MAG: long-chain-fatty-acid--CoA ligase [Acidimicrobiia bacterium]
MPEPVVDTIAALIRARADDDRVGLCFEDSSWTYAELVDACAQRASFLLAHRPVDVPFHVGVLLDNVPEFWLMLGAAALSGATLVGINPTRRGAELTRDVQHTDCALLITESSHLDLLEGAGDVMAKGSLFVVDTPQWDAELAPHARAALPDIEIKPGDVFMLIFTSGTTGAPKAVRMSHGKLTGWGTNLAGRFPLTADDVCYSAMPLFHSNAAVAGYTAPIAAGATTVLRRRFSASGFLTDVRKYGVTFFNYVGKPLTYILETPARSDDADSTLRIGFGNEAAPLDIDRFALRFDCLVVDGYGSTEGGINMSKTDDTPPGSLGVPIPGFRAAILDPDSGEECPRARFDDRGRLLNAEDAIGEIVNPDGAGSFEGYYNNPAANAQRMRDGKYWTGDLGYRDEAGFFYFAGRNSDWLRVDGENFAAAPVESVISRHPDVVLAAVYAVPSSEVGDEVMVALHLHSGVEFDAAGFVEFLAAQSDLSPKWTPRFVRISHGLPSTATQKVLKRVLQRERWECPDDVWWRPERELGYRRLDSNDIADLRARFVERDREHLLGHG